MKSKYINKMRKISTAIFTGVFLGFSLEASAVMLSNPLPGVNSFSALLQKILIIAVQIGIPVIVLMFVWTGFKFLTAQGDERKISEARSSLTWTVVGAAVLLGSWTLAQVIKNTVENITQ